MKQFARKHRVSGDGVYNLFCLNTVIGKQPEDLQGDRWERRQIS